MGQLKPLSGLWRAEVARVTDGNVYVRVIGLTGHAYGPCEAARTGTTAVGDHGTHMHAVTAGLAKGDRVLIAFVNGGTRRGGHDVVVLARLP